MNRLSAYIGFAILIFSTWTVVIGRIYVRFFMVKSMGTGDWLIIFTTFCLTVIVGIAWYLVSIGMGQHEDMLDPATILSIIATLKKYFYFNEILYAVSTITLKMSIATLLLSFCLQPIPRGIVIWTTIFYIVYGLIFVFVIAFQCVPVAAVWSDDMNAKCINKTSLTSLIYVHAVVSLVTDGIFAIMPIWLISGIQMRMRTKVSVCIVLGLGLTTAAVNLSRFFFIGALFSHTDVTYHFYPIGVTSLLEIGIGILAASMATLRPLMRLFWNKLGYSRSGTVNTTYGMSTKDLTYGNHSTITTARTHTIMQLNSTTVVEGTPPDETDASEGEEEFCGEISSSEDVSRRYPDKSDLEAIIAKYERPQKEPV